MDYKRKRSAYRPKSYKSKKSRKSGRFSDKFSTLRNGPSPYPVSLRPGQGPYSRGVYNRAAVKSDLEVKNLDTVCLWHPTTSTTQTGELVFGAGECYFLTAGAAMDGSINLIAQGSGSNNREGRKVVVKGVQTNLTFLQRPSISQAETAQSLRVIHYLDKQCNGAVPLVTDLFATLTSLTPPEGGVNMLYSLDNSQRFVILDDYSLDLNSSATLQVNSVAVQKAKTTKITCNIPLEFSGTENKISNIRSNNIGIIVIGSGNGTVNVTGTTRCLFVG